jgi:hypothetical protein
MGCLLIGAISVDFGCDKAQAPRSWWLAASRCNDGRYRRLLVAMEDAFLLVSRQQMELLARALDQQPSLVRQHRWVSPSLALLRWQ